MTGTGRRWPTWLGTVALVAIVKLMAEAFMRSRPDVRIAVPPAIRSAGALHAATELSEEQIPGFRAAHAPGSNLTVGSP
jgi:hypothetical protein